MFPTPAPDSPWSRFHAAVLADETRLVRLFATPDAPAFIAACVKLAAEIGLPLTPPEVAAAITAARCTRLTRFAA